MSNVMDTKDSEVIFLIYLMKRREFLKNTSQLSLLLMANNYLPLHFFKSNHLSKSDFGDDFKWGVASAAYQIEGAWNIDGKSPSIWDTFTQKRKNIKDGSNGNIACDFYHKYESDIALVKSLNFDIFRFSFAWTRILPNGIGKVNQKGIDFYHRVIDRCLEVGLAPWPTIYHWDLPEVLSAKGGWINRDIIAWFEEFTHVLTKAYGDKVKNWMVLNEAASFCGAGYFAGAHAPGKISFKKYYDTVHHANMVSGASGRIIRSNVSDANIGTTISCSWVDPKNQKAKHIKAAKKWDAFLNRLYLDPIIGRGYPTDAGTFFKKIADRVPSSDFDKLKFDWDFMGVQNYTRTVAKAAIFPPVLWSFFVPPDKRGVPNDQITDMNWEVSPDGFYKILKQFGTYPELKKIIVTENGAAFKDMVVDGQVNDQQRVQFFKDYLSSVLKAKNEGVPIHGYFVWSFMDNFEWAEGYRPRFGLVYVDYNTQKRIVKNSGLWFKEFLKD